MFVAALGVLATLGILRVDLGATAQQPVDWAAQDPVAPVDYSDEIPAHISAVDGAATLEREGRIEAAEENIILLAGDRLRTARGRLEILYADGSSVAVDEHTTLDLLDDSLMRLLGGRVKMIIARATGALEYRIDTAAGSAMVRTPGEYRVALLERRALPEIDLTVLRGTAELINDHGRTVVRAGTYAVANAGQAPSLPYVANSASWTDFERWADDQRSARLGAYSTRHLPREVHYYAGAFDRYGDWNYEPTYGYVWYPRVATGWRPYHHGKWSFHLRFGWFWVGAGRWAWPTHHYGRWGVSSGRWYWIPDRHWGPAWVSWAHTPGFVSWCPLGFNNRPVFSITTITVNHRQPWHGWTVLPSRHFVPNVVVPRHVVTSASIPVSTWNDFRPSRPNLREDPAPIRSVGATRGYAVPRSSVGSGAAGDRQAATISRPNGPTTGTVPSARSVQRDGAAPGAALPSGSRSPVGSRLGTPNTPVNRAVPSDRPGTPIESRSPVRLRSAPAPDSGTGASTDRPAPSVGSPSRIGPPSRTRPDDRPAAPPSGTAIRRTQPAPAPSSSSGWGGPSRQATPPPDRSPAPSVRTPDAGRETPSGSRRAPGAIRSAPPSGAGGGSSAPSRSAPSRVEPRGGSSGSSAPSRSSPSRVEPRGGSSAPQRSTPPPRASGGEGSRQPPPSSSNRGQAVRRGGGN